MILYPKNQAIKYIAINYCINTHNRQNVDLKNFVLVTNLGNVPSDWQFEDTYSFNYKRNPGYAYAVYLGDASTIEDEINKKINPNSPDTFNKVYFDSLCKYPRFKLSSTTNIKKSLDPSKADSVIISRKINNFENYISKPCTSKERRNNILILYSEKENTYYIIDYYPEKLSYPSQTTILQTLISKYATVLDSDLRKWASALINSNVLPEDCKEFYNGKVVLTYSNEETQFINNLFTKYKFITYDTELDRFVSKHLQKPTNEDLQTIQRMFESADNSVVDLGTKLLLNYDLSSSICAVGTIIASNWENIRNCSASRSVGFTQVLDSLGLNYKKLSYSNTDDIVNILYKNSRDKEDKRQAKEAIINKLRKELMQDWKESYAQRFKNLGLTFKFTIE